MKKLLRSEELAQFALCLIALVAFKVPWWCYLLVVIGPDIGMVGYLMNSRVGAITYNVLHHKGLAVLIIIVAKTCDALRMFASTTPTEHGMLIVGIILFGHASMDRIFGYGLKFGDSFQHTHLGWIGKLKDEGQEQEVGNIQR